MIDKRITLLIALVALILFAGASSKNEQPLESWILSVSSADRNSETDFNLSLALGEHESGLTQSTHTTPYMVELDAEMILAVAASASETPLRIQLKDKRNRRRLASGQALRCIAGRNVNEGDHFVRAF